MRGFTSRHPRVVSTRTRSPRGKASDGLSVTSGARVMLSTPPAMTRSASSARIRRATDESDAQGFVRGEPVAADEALRIGLVSRVWPDAEFAVKWRELAQTLARGATEAFALTKEGLNVAMARGFAEFLEHEAELQDRAGRSRDYAEGVRAFSQKRPAKMEGR